MQDINGNPIRFYRVVYERNLAGQKERLRYNVIMSEWQLQQTLYDFESKYLYLVISADYLPNYTGNEH